MSVASSKKSTKPAAQPGFPVHPALGVATVILTYIAAPYIVGTLISIVLGAVGWSQQQIVDWTQDNAAAQFIYVLLFDACITAVIIAVMRSSKAKWADIGLIKPKLTDIGATLLAYPPYFVLNAAALLVATKFLHVDGNQQQQTGFDAATSPLQLVITFAALVILPPIVEEIAMRGFLFSSLKSQMAAVPAALLTSVLFATAHLQFNQDAPLLWTAAIDTFILSLTLCYLRQRTGRLWAGIGLHMLKNFLAFLALYIIPNFRL